MIPRAQPMRKHAAEQKLTRVRQALLVKLTNKLQYRLALKPFIPISECPLDYHTATQLRRHHPAWKLLQANHAALTISFLDEVFIQPNERSLSESHLQARLEDRLFQLRETEGDDAFPQSAAHYLNDWADNDKGWLRKFYPANSDEAHFDLTPAAEKAIQFLNGLTQRQFVGTESRLKTVFDLLQQMLEGVETDKQTRLNDLEKRKAEIEEEIARVESGDIEIMEETAVRERFQQLSTTARELLSDFREVEQNFRQLDRQAREQITTWEGRKGALLDEIFGERDAIADSDQGRTFRAFWDFLMSPTRQQQLTDGLQQVLSLEAVQQMNPDQRIKRVHYDWLEAGEQTQRTVARLSAQLRRFLDDKAFLENKRIMQLIQSVEGHAIGLRGERLDGTWMTLESPKADINLPMERPLFTPPLRPALETSVTSGDESEVDPQALFNQIVVDRTRLQAAISRELRQRSQVTLAQVIEAHPLQVGLAELVTYLALAGDDPRASFDESQRQTIEWRDDDGTLRQARAPLIVFTRAGS